jgi:hypothetical protein
MVIVEYSLAGIVHIVHELSRHEMSAWHERVHAMVARHREIQLSVFIRKALCRTQCVYQCTERSLVIAVVNALQIFKLR